MFHLRKAGVHAAIGCSATLLCAKSSSLKFPRSFVALLSGPIQHLQFYNSGGHSFRCRDFGGWSFSQNAVQENKTKLGPSASLRHKMTLSGSLFLQPMGFLRFVKEKIIPSKMTYKRRVLFRAGMRLYLCSVELLDFEEFRTEFKLPDTFQSWFKIALLHIWIVITRLAREGKDGIYTRNHMVKNMWVDVHKRMKLIGSSVKIREEGALDFDAHFRYALFAYDEGLLSDDKSLASAVWRTFFDQQCDDPVLVENLVHYIRKQVHHVEHQKSEDILKTGIVSLLPIHGDTINKARFKAVTEDIKKRLHG